MLRRTALVAALAAATLAPPAHAHSGYQVNADCRFGGVLLLDDTIHGWVAATAHAVGPTGVVATEVSVTCVMDNSPGGGTDSVTASQTAPGSAVAAANVFSGWDANRQPRVCVSARATFSDMVVRTLPTTCAP